MAMTLTKILNPLPNSCLLSTNFCSKCFFLIILFARHSAWLMLLLLKCAWLVNSKKPSTDNLNLLLKNTISVLYLADKFRTWCHWTDWIGQQCVTQLNDYKSKTLTPSYSSRHDDNLYRQLPFFPKKHTKKNEIFWGGIVVLIGETGDSINNICLLLCWFKTSALLSHWRACLIKLIKEWKTKINFELRCIYTIDILPKTMTIYYIYLKPCDPIQYNNHIQ